MPIYEYQCRKCGHRFERIQRFSDALIKKCPECGGRVDQLLSAPAVQFKGSGWYVTDYARKGSGAGSKHEPSEGKTDSTKDSGAKKDGKGETAHKRVDKNRQ